MVFRRQGGRPQSRGTRFVVRLPSRYLHTLYTPYISVRFQLRVCRVPSALRRVISLVCRTLLRTLRRNYTVRRLGLVITRGGLYLYGLTTYLQVYAPTMSRHRTGTGSNGPFLRVFRLLLRFLPFGISARGRRLVLIVPMGPMVKGRKFR